MTETFHGTTTQANIGHGTTVGSSVRISPYSYNILYGFDTTAGASPHFSHSGELLPEDLHRIHDLPEVVTDRPNRFKTAFKL
ncbi:MAG: hypothetical protein ABSD75_26105 [Terriglobales bacterium]